MHVQALAFKGR